MHLKPQSLQEIETEVQALDHNHIEFLKDGEMIQNCQESGGVGE